MANMHSMYVGFYFVENSQTERNIKMKKIIKLVLAFASVALLIAPFAGAQKQVGAQDEEINIAVVQLVSHPSLDDINGGIIDQLAEEGYVEGENLTVNQQNAEGDITLLQSIADQVVADQPDLIFAITTQVAQTLQNATSEIPIIMAGVTDPVAALVVDSLEAPGANITGVSDAVPLEEHFNLMLSIQPDIQTLGMMYTTSDDSGTAETEQAQAIAEEMGLTVVVEGIAQAIDMQMVGQQLVSQVDAVYIGSDNTIASAFETLVDITDAEGIGVYPSVDNMVRQGGVAALAINQADVGKQAAIMGVEVFQGADTASMPVQFVENIQQLYNSEVAANLGIEIPDEILAELTDVAGEAVQ